MGISQEVLDEIGADVEQAVASIAAKYGMSIRYLPCDENGEIISLEVLPLSPEEVSNEVRRSPYWKTFLGDAEGSDDERR